MSIVIQFLFRRIDQSLQNPRIRNIFIGIETSTDLHCLRAEYIVPGSPRHLQLERPAVEAHNADLVQGGERRDVRRIEKGA